MALTWSSLELRDEGCVDTSGKLLCLLTTHKNYAGHAWQYSMHV